MNVMVDNIQVNGYILMINEGLLVRIYGIINFGGNRRKEVFVIMVVGIFLIINYFVGDICWFMIFLVFGIVYVGVICVIVGNGFVVVWCNFGVFV